MASGLSVEDANLPQVNPDSNPSNEPSKAKPSRLAASPAKAAPIKPPPNMSNRGNRYIRQELRNKTTFRQ